MHLDQFLHQVQPETAPLDAAGGLRPEVAREQLRHVCGIDADAVITYDGAGPFALDEQLDLDVLR
jgi:hypothetical protein